MADIFGILSNSYKTAPTPSSSNLKYVPVDPTHYNGTWNGVYSTGEKFAFTISNVQGFRAKVNTKAAPAQSNFRTC